MQFSALRARLDRISCLGRVGLVAGGYVGALAVAVLAFIAYAYATSGPDRDASSGMYAFADALYFLLAFSAASIIPTGLLLHFLRVFAGPWRVFASTGLGVSLTGVLAAAEIARAPVEYGFWSSLAVPRVFLAPLLAGLFVLVGIFSPSRANQRCLLAAAGIECMTSGYGFLHWFVPAILS